MRVSRGGEFLATFKSAAALDTSTTLDSLVYISAADTVALVTTLTNIGIGVARQTGPSSTVVNLFIPTRRGIAGGTVTAGGKIIQQTGTAKIIDAAGTITSNPIIGHAVTAGSANAIIEWIPYTQNGAVVIA